jgi:hypothetical protein
MTRPAIFFVAICLLLPTGCRSWYGGAAADGTPVVGELANPMFVPAMDREFLWNQTVDAVDDYFRIERERRVQVIDGVALEGRIDTYPTDGSTIFEPWRGDSRPGYERWLATAQSMRRYATVRVMPTEGGYLVQVHVQKELEDLDRPEHATAGGQSLRHDGAVERPGVGVGGSSITLGWIPKGRDKGLEQKILDDLYARLSDAGQPVRLPEAP